jgi:hypothetical protein
LLRFSSIRFWYWTGSDHAFLRVFDRWARPSSRELNSNIGHFGEGAAALARIGDPHRSMIGYSRTEPAV